MLNDTMVQNRLVALEREMAELKQRLNRALSGNTWLERLAGSMVDEPDFDRVLEFGRAARSADKPGEEQP